jgi:hypothetical protein
VAIEGVKRFCGDFPLHTSAQTAGLILHLYRSYLEYSIILLRNGCLRSTGPMAVPRSSGNPYERLLWRKQTLRI